MDLATLNRLLEIGFEKGVSDIHFQVGYPPLFRARGQLIRSKLENLSESDTEFIAKTILEANRKKLSEDFTEMDTSYSVSKIGRFRVSIFRQRNSFGVVMRTIPHKIRSIDELNLPVVLKEISLAPHGLVVVNGPTGNGKSTTIAAMVQLINETCQYNILTVEDPIEFLFSSGSSCVVQREVGTDTKDFTLALRAAMRMDPDVIMVGEMRDLETIDACIKSAETGHLVFSTLHTNSATSTINRIVSYFSVPAQEVIRQRLADILVATVSLRLLKTKDGNAVYPACEIMRNIPVIQACIRENRLNDIKKHMERGGEQYKMQTFDQHLVQLCKQNIISLEEALQASTSSDLERNLMVSS